MWQVGGAGELLARIADRKPPYLRPKRTLIMLDEDLATFDEGDIVVDVDRLSEHHAVPKLVRLQTQPQPTSRSKQNSRPTFETGGDVVYNYEDRETGGHYTETVLFNGTEDVPSIVLRGPVMHL
jgi:hypothetical protein